MDAVLQQMANAMSDALGAPLAVFLLSIIPIAEARFAIPFGMKMGLAPGQAFGWAFLGSSLMAPILIILFMPIINALSRTKLFSKIGSFLYDKFEKKSRSLAKTLDGGDEPNGSKFALTKNDLKKMGGTALFVAVPLPLTGVWTGSAVASILKIGFVKSLIGVIAGNACACGIITIIAYLCYDYIDIIMWVFVGIIAVVVIVLTVKFILYKPNKTDGQDDGGNTNQ